jgi:heme oxygenase (mycobilin-producing)
LTNFFITLRELRALRGGKSFTQKGEKEDPMAVKVLIRRNVPENKAREMIPLFRKMRTLANEQAGYITGETMRNLEKPDEFLVISTWETSDDWELWLQSKDRQLIQSQIDVLLGGKTEYEIYHYGFAE